MTIIAVGAALVWMFWLFHISDIRGAKYYYYNVPVVLFLV